MLNLSRRDDSQSQLRPGFTLVEMMVAMALVLLMMAMFAEIFTLATGSMSKQKSLAELDQRQRTVSTIIRNDIQDRTFFNVTPFHPNNSTLANMDANYIDPSSRGGYFFISENDLDNDIDDTLQFTVSRDLGKLFYGKTAELTANGGGVSQNPSQPESDDSLFNHLTFASAAINGASNTTIFNNNAGASPDAEIAYFVRNGTLYRRVLLIRNPAIGSDPLPGSEQPLSAFVPATMMSPAIPPFRLFRPGINYPVTYVNGSNGNFLGDFDYSATFDFANKQIEILGHTRLLYSGVGFDPFVLALSRNRFGFNPLTGKPVEYLGGVFFGRYTHEETSNSAFGWPGDPGPNQGPDGVFLTADDTFGSASDTNPYTRSNLSLTPSGVVIDSSTGNPVYPSGFRQGEDMLLTNVVGFDVKVWDARGGPGPDALPGLAGIDDDGINGIDDAYGELGAPLSDDGAWVDIGNAGAFGFYSQSNNWNPNFGPRAPAINRCFDTWHPNQPGPIAPFVYHPGADHQPGVATVDDDGANGTDDPGELGSPNSDDIPIPRLKAIQIKIRYRDITSNLVREVTIVEQLTAPINQNNTN